MGGLLFCSTFDDRRLVGDDTDATDAWLRIQCDDLPGWTSLKYQGQERARRFMCLLLSCSPPADGHAIFEHGRCSSWIIGRVGLWRNPGLYKSGR